MPVGALLLALSPQALGPMAQGQGLGFGGHAEAVGMLTGAGKTPIRLVCTGHAGGGAWAQLCGPWAQVNFPFANVRVITFGAPR